MLEYTNLKLFVIYHALELENKRAVFINEYKSTMISASKGIENNLNILNEHLDSQYFLAYEEVLKKLPVSEIKTYANRIVKELLLSLEKPTVNEPSTLKKISTVIWEGFTVQNVAIGVGVVVSCILAYKLIAWLISNNETIFKGATIQKDAASISQQGTTLQGDTISSSTDIVKLLQTLFKNILPRIGAVLKKQSTEIAALQKDKEALVEITGLLHSYILRLNTALKEQKVQITQLIEFIKTLKDDEE
jgi:hypothetical protein